MFISPMLLDTRSEPFNHADFLYEPKANGVRLELDRSNDGVALYTRHATNVTLRLPEIASLEVEDGTILDGEVVCYYPEDPHKEDFEAIMKRINSTKEMAVKAAMNTNPATLLVFDILMHKGKSVMNQPLIERKQLLNDVVVEQKHLKKVLCEPTNGVQLFETVKQFDLEGIVAKHKDSRYTADARPKDVWYKIINWRYLDCYIVGYRKDKSGWYIAIPEGENFKNVGFMEFGMNNDHKQAFYQVVKSIIVREKKDVVWIKPLLRCQVKHRGFNRSANAMTPVFVDFIK